MTIEAPQEVMDPKMEKAKKRYDEAAKALADEGAMNFIELVETRNPAAMEYMLALNEYSEAMGADNVSMEALNTL